MGYRIYFEGEHVGDMSETNYQSLRRIERHCHRYWIARVFNLWMVAFSFILLTILIVAVNYGLWFFCEFGLNNMKLVQESNPIGLENWAILARTSVVLLSTVSIIPCTYLLLFFPKILGYNNAHQLAFRYGIVEVVPLNSEG